MQNKTVTIGAILLAGSCLLATPLVSLASTAENDKDYGPKEPIVWTKPVKAVVFYHQTHAKNVELSCEECHDELFAMKKGEAEKNDDFTMKSLYEGKYCGKCHNGSTAFASDTRCNTCHIGVKGYDQMTGASGGHGDAHNAPKAGH